MNDFPILSALIALPALGGVLCLLAPKETPETSRRLALTVSLVTFLASVPLFWLYQVGEGHAAYQLVETYEWAPSIGLGYTVGIDGMSMLLIILSTMLTPVAILASWNAIKDRQPLFFAMLLFLEAAVVGVFCAMDLVLFYVFFEFSLVPMLLLIGVYGGKRRIYAAYKFFIYTMVGSLLMLAAIVYVYFRATDSGMPATFDMRAIAAGLAALPDGAALSSRESTWLFFAFALAFCIKVPVFPLHTWLPDAHTEAPTAGSVMLAAVLLKMGAYGLIRVAIPFFPHGFMTWAPALGVLAVIGIVYGALMALAQTDMKKLIAYSSVSHLGFVILGIVAWNEQALLGSVYQMLGHGLSTGVLFLVIGALYERHHTRLIEDYGGVGKVAPKLAVVFMIATLSSVGLPGLNGFVGEFLILLGAFQWWEGLTAIAALGVILGAVYLFTLYQRLMLGTPRNPEHSETADLTTRELLYMAPLCLVMLLMGLFPTPFLDKVAPSIGRLLKAVSDATGT